MQRHLICSGKSLYITSSLLHIHKVIRERAIEVQRFLFRTRTQLRSIKLCRLPETTQTILRSWGRIRTPWIGIEAIAEEYAKIHFIALLSLNAPFHLSSWDLFASNLDFHLTRIAAPTLSSIINCSILSSLKEIKINNLTRVIAN